jgi:hypothetical protein
MWKSIGSACTLQLQPESVYRALEAGWTLETILQALEHHGTRPVPATVIESVRTWSNKRERLTIYPSAALFEFSSAPDLDLALARGLVGTRLSGRLLIVPDESRVDYRHFRLNGTRDYGQPLDRCVTVANDGVTLTIDSARADLLLETELRRFAHFIEESVSNNGRQYRVSFVSLARAREHGFGVHALEEWFAQRTGKALPPAIRLLASSANLHPLSVRRELVLQVSSSEIADGLLQWPGTRDFISARLGPLALVVCAEHLSALAEKLNELGVELRLSETTQVK